MENPFQKIPSLDQRKNEFESLATALSAILKRVRGVRTQDLSEQEQQAMKLAKEQSGLYRAKAKKD